MTMPIRTRHRFTKPGGQVAEIKERSVISLDALEWIVFIDDAQVESRLYLKYREDLYEPELRERIEALKADGWLEDLA
jgi:hypothetical protein